MAKDDGIGILVSTLVDVGDLCIYEFWLRVVPICGLRRVYRATNDTQAPESNLNRVNGHANSTRTRSSALSFRALPSQRGTDPDAHACSLRFAQMVNNVGITMTRSSVTAHTGDAK